MMETYGPPFDGPWLEWPAGAIAKMSAARSVYEAHKSMHASNGDYMSWKDAHPNYHAIVQQIIELKLSMKE